MALQLSKSGHLNHTTGKLFYVASLASGTARSTSSCSRGWALPSCRVTLSQNSQPVDILPESKLCVILFVA